MTCLLEKKQVTKQIYDVLSLYMCEYIKILGRYTQKVFS